MAQRKCRACENDLDDRQFSINSHIKDGLSTMCRACTSEYKAQLPSRQPERRRQDYKQGRYGLTPARYAEMFIEQGGKCAICGASDYELCIDHDHITGKVRGLLCTPCNVSLGNFEDSEERLLSAVAYLRRSRE